MFKQLINNEEFTSIQQAQAGLTKLLLRAKSRNVFYRVMKSNKPMGVLVPNNIWSSLIEDLEALSSPNYLERIRRSRLSKRRYSAAEIKKMFKIKA